MTLVASPYPCERSPILGGHTVSRAVPRDCDLSDRADKAGAGGQSACAAPSTAAQVLVRPGAFLP